jgi:hypothetical protein
MCEPSRFVAIYRAVIEQGLGVTAHVAENERALMFTYDEIVYVLRNTAPQNPGLLDIAVYLPNDEVPDIKAEACRQVALSLPCLHAWVDSDGDIVLNVQSLTGPIRLMPSIGTIKEVLPEALEMLRQACVRVFESAVLAGIVNASGDAGASAKHRQEPL